MLQTTNKENLKKDSVSGAIIINAPKTRESIEIERLKKRVEKLEKIVYKLFN